MGPRSIGSLRLFVGQVVIPLKLFTAVSERTSAFHQLHGKCGSRISVVKRCKAEGVDLEHADLVSGYEYTPGQFVVFSQQELAQLTEEARPRDLRIAEVVPVSTLPLEHVRKTLYLGPDRGAEKAYALITEALESARVAAVGQLGGRSRDELVVVRTRSGRLVLHEMFYGGEVRALDDIEVASAEGLQREHRRLAALLVAGLRQPAFDAARFVDGAAVRLKRAIDAKVAGKEIVVPPSNDDEPVELLEALQRSVFAAPKKASARGAARRRAG